MLQLLSLSYKKLPQLHTVALKQQTYSAHFGLLNGRKFDVIFIQNTYQYYINTKKKKLLITFQLLTLNSQLNF